MTKQYNATERNGEEIVGDNFVPRVARTTDSKNLVEYLVLLLLLVCLFIYSSVFTFHGSVQRVVVSDLNGF
jgi:hypothetical protein